jgi:hypothetical protein
MMNNSSPFEFLEHHPSCEYITRDCKALTVKEFAELYQIAEITVRKKYLNGKLPMYKVAGRVRGFKCWLGVSIRNPEVIKKIQKENPAISLDISSTDKNLVEVSQ